MNRRNIFSVLMAISILMLAACTAGAPTATTSNHGGNNTVPTVTDNSNSGAATSTMDNANVSTTAPTESGDTNSTASNLACSNGAASASPTVELTEGPYYKTGSPEQANLVQAGMAGTKLVLSGYVYDTNCKPVANAWLDFWQADANGNYDNSAYALRGHQFTDANGRYELTTVVPGIYPGRTEHIHVKVQELNGKIITSQLFFPGVQLNESDNIFNSSLVISIQESGNTVQGQFNFVVPAK
jgi:protocatechuate 3,4-dioxygenase beta subunit